MKRCSCSSAQLEGGIGKKKVGLLKASGTAMIQVVSSKPLQRPGRGQLNKASSTKYGLPVGNTTTNLVVLPVRTGTVQSEALRIQTKKKASCAFVLTQGRN